MKSNIEREATFGVNGTSLQHSPLVQSHTACSVFQN